MEIKPAMVICSSQVAKELVEMDENFKQVICMCPWLDDNDSVLVVDKSAWNELIDSGEICSRADVVGVKKHEDD